MKCRRSLILGAAGRDFHNFNVAFRGRREEIEVVAFTATQIPNIAGRRYPAELAGPGYPDGIPIVAEEEMPRLIREQRIDEVIFAYSDVSHEQVMHLGSAAVAAGADFRLLGADSTMIPSRLPLVSICAVRTGAGKSPATRRVVEALQAMGLRPVAIRHPMPYGDLTRQRVQRFASYEDLERNECTIEEREEYEPHIARKTVVYAGVDYAAILAEAEKEADVILWDGGNNDTPFYRSDLEIVIADPHRLGHETRYFPGEVNLRRADVVVISKVNTAPAGSVEELAATVQRVNPAATLVRAAVDITLEKPELVAGKRVLVLEDGPTLTHGEMAYGAGVLAARRHGAAELVDPRPYAVGRVAETLCKYPHVANLLPTVGYGQQQVADLEETIRRTPADAVVIGTPIDLGRFVRIDRPVTRVFYELRELSTPDLRELLAQALDRQ